MSSANQFSFGPWEEASPFGCYQTITARAGGSSRTPPLRGCSGRMHVITAWLGWAELNRNGIRITLASYFTERRNKTHTTHNPLTFFLRVSTLYSHPAPPAAPPLPPAGCPSRPVSAPAGPGRRSPAPGRRATRTNTPTPPANTHTHTQNDQEVPKETKKREDEWIE